MDPLSVSAAVVGLLTAGASVIDLLHSIKGMPKLARNVMSEVEEIKACLNLLHTFLSGTVTASRSRTALIMIDQVRVVLTDCVITFSELKATLDVISEKIKRLGALDRFIWAAKEKTIADLLRRLQGSRLSMNLMLTTLNW